MKPVTRPIAGTRPAEPVISLDPPDDYLCCWSVRTPAGEPLYWELKFIHAGCAIHRKIQAI